MGIQPYSDMLGMGDLPSALLPAIVCLSCGTRWRDREAFDRGEPEPADETPEGAAWESEEPDGPDEPTAADQALGAAPSGGGLRSRAAPSRTSATG